MNKTFYLYKTSGAASSIFDIGNINLTPLAHSIDESELVAYAQEHQSETTIQNQYIILPVLMPAPKEKESEL